MTSITKFGPEGNQWQFDHESKTYDLTRGRKGAFKMAPRLTPPATSLIMSSEITALVVVDMQNLFLDSKCGSHPNGLAAAERIPDLVAKCRKKGIQIIWLNWGLEDQDLQNLPAGLQRNFTRSLLDPNNTPTRIGLGNDLGKGMGRTLMNGEWNTAIWPPLAAIAQPEDIHCTKNRLSGLWNSDQPLWKHLVDSEIASLMFAGVQTDQCILGTLQDAYSAGWDCIMVEDCCATTTTGGQEVCIQNVAVAYGFVVRSESVISGLNEQ